MRPTRPFATVIIGIVVTGSIVLATGLAGQTPTLRIPNSALHQPAVKLDTPGLGNLGQVSSRIFRGAQPTEEGFKELAKLGVGIVVNLRSKSEAELDEMKIVEGLGIRYVTIPMSGVGAPSKEELTQVLAVIEQNPQTTVFIHCRRGAERTGMAIAAYRIVMEGWTPEEALDEMKAFDFRYNLYPNFVHLVREMPKLLSPPSMKPTLTPSPAMS